ATPPPSEKELTLPIPPALKKSESPEPPSPASDKTKGKTGSPHKLNISARERTWLQVTVDDQRKKDVILQPGQSLEFSAENSFLLQIGNAGGIRLIFDGKELSPLGVSGQVIRNLRLPLAERQG